MTTASINIGEHLFRKVKEEIGLVTASKEELGLDTEYSDSTFEIKGSSREIVELAEVTLGFHVYSSAVLTPPHGIIKLIYNKKAEWRFFGRNAKIAHFLFQTEIDEIREKYKDISIKATPADLPDKLLVTCCYSDYSRVKQELEQIKTQGKHGIETPTKESVEAKFKFLKKKEADRKVYCEDMGNGLISFFIVSRHDAYTREAVKEFDQMVEDIK